MTPAQAPKFLTDNGTPARPFAYDQGPRKAFEPFLIAMDDASEVFPTFEHPGTVLSHMIEGESEYWHGQHAYLLSPGDSLTFRGDVPHGPERLVRLPIRFLSVIACRS